MSSYRDVAAEVRAEMARQSITGVQAARELGWTQNYISRRLSGKVPFDVEDLARLAKLLDVPVTAFFDRGVGAMISQFITPEVRKPGSCPTGFDPASIRRGGGLSPSPARAGTLLPSTPTLALGVAA